MEKKARPGRVLVKCSLCGSVLNKDYKKMHQENIHGGNLVKIKIVTVPDNPLTLAANQKNRERESIPSTSKEHANGRELQCEETNKEPMGGKLYNWRSYFKDDEPCALYCQNDVNQFSKRAPRVQDGTKCRGGSKDICVAGVCVIVGCDLKLNSNSVEDVCGICNGDGTQCKIVDETYADKGARDYKKIVTIPAGSRKIVIDELGPSENTIAISDKTEKNYYLNANHNEELDGVKHFGKIEGIYTHTEPGRENLVINGPITDDLIFWNYLQLLSLIYRLPFFLPSVKDNQYENRSAVYRFPYPNLLTGFRIVRLLREEGGKEGFKADLNIAFLPWYHASFLPPVKYEQYENCSTIYRFRTLIYKHHYGFCIVHILRKEGRKEGRQYLNQALSFRYQ
ncbi:unnamed protein product [Brassicogethes aeneus]|uniref:Uncharacterized protein n=1 Tax=Brassicogethes aeneus TaxID=1431903 RepID=A0A9P0FF94_BRAAE|nr:unnamed protein product [Brassicogethes aeneus]